MTQKLSSRTIELNNLNPIDVRGLAQITKKVMQELGLTDDTTFIINGSTALYLSPVAKLLQQDTTQNIGILYVSAKPKDKKTVITNSRTQIVERYARQNWLRVTIDGVELYDFTQKTSPTLLPWYHPARSPKQFEYTFQDLGLI